MQTPEDADKHGLALRQQRFQMLEDIAQELRTDVVFPTCFDVAIKLREMLSDENVALDKLSALISLDPLIPVRLLRLANSAAYNPAGQTVRDVKSAVIRLGLKVVRATALATAMKQLLRSRDMAEFKGLADTLWEHSLLSASAAYVIARRLTRLNADEAMLAGLIHDLGAFYMLYRATHYPELRSRPDTVRYLVAQWHESIGVTLVEALRVPGDIVEAIRDHDQPRDIPDEPRTLADVVHVSNVIAGGGVEWLLQEGEDRAAECLAEGSVYHVLEAEIHAHAKDMRAAFD
jgi:HD-like signal output (HDOD) protein